MTLEGANLEHYHLVQLIGSGGMGEVYLAEDTRLHRNVAIKVCKTETLPYPNPASEQHAAHLFQHEARAIAQLDHPHILQLYGFGEQQLNDALLTYLVMPYCQEGSLTTWLHHRGSATLLPPHAVAHIVTQAADALQYAHNREIVHQDVKPANFLIHSQETPDPDLPDLLLADFGIAKMASATSQSNYSVRGTAVYMAPEQWAGSPVPATDQYALAIMAYELLIGQPPFQGRSEQVMYAHINTSPQRPSALSLNLSKDIDEVILMALAKSPAARFMSITAFARAFQQAAQAANEPTVITMPQDCDLHTTLAISRAEAQHGANRVLNLPGGRLAPIAIPAGAVDGQVLRLNGLGASSSVGVQGALILTILVKDGETMAQPINLDQNTIIRSAPATTAVVDEPYSLPNNGDYAPTLSAFPFQPGVPALSLQAWQAETPTWQPVQSQPWQSSQAQSTAPATPTWQPVQLQPEAATVAVRQPPAKARQSGPLIALLVAIILILLVASASGVYYFGFYTPQHNGGFATATINAGNSTHTANIATSQAATATANTQGSPVSSPSPSNLSPTPTINVIAGQVSATQTANAGILNPYGFNSSQIIVNDPLLDNSAGNHWDIPQANGLGTCDFHGNAYHVIERKANWFMNCMMLNPNYQSLGDFIFQVNMTIVSGDQGGLDFRQAANGKFYNFRIDKNGNYEIDTYVDNTNTNAQVLQTGSVSNFNVGYDSTNTLAVVAQGNSITIYVNSSSQAALNVSDNTYSSGSIGFIAQASGGNRTDVAFSNALVWRIP